MIPTFDFSANLNYFPHSVALKLLCENASDIARRNVDHDNLYHIASYDFLDYNYANLGVTSL